MESVHIKDHKQYHERLLQVNRENGELRRKLFAIEDAVKPLAKVYESTETVTVEILRKHIGAVIKAAG
jgi:hypothetical protein